MRWQNGKAGMHNNFVLCPMMRASSFLAHWAFLHLYSYCRECEIFSNVLNTRALRFAKTDKKPALRMENTTGEGKKRCKIEKKGKERKGGFVVNLLHQQVGFICTGVEYELVFFAYIFLPLHKQNASLLICWRVEKFKVAKSGKRPCIRFRTLSAKIEIPRARIVSRLKSPGKRSRSTK